MLHIAAQNLLFNLLQLLCEGILRNEFLAVQSAHILKRLAINAIREQRYELIPWGTAIILLNVYGRFSAKADTMMSTPAPIGLPPAERHSDTSPSLASDRRTDHPAFPVLAIRAPRKSFY